jgi:hypothetical protein
MGDSMNNKYEHVWLDNEGMHWFVEPGEVGYHEYGPFTEHVLAPADSIVIESSELPEVVLDHYSEDGEEMLTVAGAAFYGTHRGAARLREDACGLLAVSQFMDTRPPEDTKMIDRIMRVPGVSRGVARRLLADDGLTIEITPETDPSNAAAAREAADELARLAQEQGTDTTDHRPDTQEAVD